MTFTIYNGKNAIGLGGKQIFIGRQKSKVKTFKYIYRGGLVDTLGKMRLESPLQKVHVLFIP